MLHFLVAVVAVASANPAVIDSPSPFCPAPIIEDVLTKLRVESFCLHPVVVPEDQAAQFSVANRKAYCGQLTEDKRALAEITGATATPVNFCDSIARTFPLASGTHYIGVSRARIPLQVTLEYHNTKLGCNDEVPASLVGVPLAFEPTEHKCALILPGRTILEIKNIQSRDEESAQNQKNCVRVRMGKRMRGLYWQWAPVCEIPAGDSYDYELGCGAVVMDASSEAIERVEFMLKPMDDLKAVLAPLMCSNDAE
ncbi:hypothetical protein PMAYCL1PPCAC_09984 [Pristionchus mayeri]|uniref:Uncharacterized protein n=1 Tax=Pristionchus mayeri TaxID=1317129 RepID=A0AAN4ZH19_9BILA|nr:hypothetical protein PMAYCL1PPCAC_09984 [Pristionchus mayeri]